MNFRFQLFGSFNILNAPFKSDWLKSERNRKGAYDILPKTHNGCSRLSMMSYIYARECTNCFQIYHAIPNSSIIISKTFLVLLARNVQFGKIFQRMFKGWILGISHSLSICPNCPRSSSSQAEKLEIRGPSGDEIRDQRYRSKRKVWSRWSLSAENWFPIRREIAKFNICEKSFDRRVFVW